MNYYKRVNPETNKLMGLCKQNCNFIEGLNKLYFKIDKKEFNEIIKENPDIQIDAPRKLYESDIKSFKYLYDKYYLWYIYKIIHEYHGEYRWVNLIDTPITGTWADKEHFTRCGNKYINEGIDLNDHTYLANDILKNGMYFPFMIRDGNKTDGYEIVLGSHRLYSLYLLEPEKLKEKDFLCIKIPFNDNSFKIYKDLTSPTCDYNYYYSNKDNAIFAQKAENKIDFIKKFLWFSDNVAFLAFDERKETPPHPILNNKELFEEFINGPEPTID